jgi:hypothetical protein
MLEFFFNSVFNSVMNYSLNIFSFQTVELSKVCYIYDKGILFFGSEKTMQGVEPITITMS